MALHIGLDDTDGEKRMCTTYVATELVRKLSKDYEIIGYPRLVRLNPNIPWKTRGNGALSLSIGKGYGKRFLVGNIERKDIYGFEKGRPLESTEEVFRVVKDTVEENAAFEDRKTNPAFVIASKKPSVGLYWDAVRSIVELPYARRIAKKYGVEYKSYKNGRGLIGALAAAAWRPRDYTYEILTYRERKRWGTTRRVKKDSVMRMDKKFRKTFNNYDYQNKRPAIIPSSPCPILFGIRGDNYKELVPAMKTIASEKKERWVIFKTNQATDEHLVNRNISNVNTYESVMVKGTVAEIPKTILGGHVIFRLEKDGYSIDAAAYEPTKQFRNVVRALIPGDVVEVYGGVRSQPRTINIEKVRVEKLASLVKKVANPLCRKCNKRMKSIGKGQGYRCIKCGARSNKPRLKTIKRELRTAFYEPPVCARRHLSKSLKRM